MNALSYARLVIITAIMVLFSISANATPVIKKSKSVLCHPPSSAWYERTKNYTSYETLEKCLNSGGKLPAGVKKSQK